jgi:hypothetical protein
MSGCPGTDGLDYIFFDTTVSAVQSDLDARQEVAEARGATHTAWIDGDIGVVDSNPAPGTASALERLGFTSYTYGSGSAG